MYAEERQKTKQQAKSAMDKINLYQIKSDVEKSFMLNVANARRSKL